MKKIVSITLLAILCTAGAGVRAQGHEDILRFSRYNYSFGTARSAAMGGAFASLGADLSVMTLNPAGLGMYRGSELSLSPSFSSTSIRTTNFDDLGTFDATMNKSHFTLNNAGVAFNLYAGSGNLTSVTFGFNYNKLADLGSASRVIGRSDRNSMLDMFAEQLSNQNVDPDAIGGYLDNGKFPNGDFNLLGALMAYDAYLTNKPAADANGNFIYGLNDQLSPGAITRSDFRKTTRGTVGQYDLGLGMNLSNTVYVGLGFGLQNLWYKETADYYESFEGNTAQNPTRVENWSRVQVLEQSGSAWNFKIGTIVRPVEELRIGLAFHTPTYIRMEENYVADLYANFAGSLPDPVNADNTHSPSAVFTSEYRMRTPMRLIGGISYNFFNTAILSLDYERVWYNQMKMFRDGYNDEDLAVTEAVKNEYRPANNLRVGLETMVASNLFARLGYAWYDSMYKNSNLKKFGTTSNYSAGLGYRTGSWGIDLAYIYMDTGTAPAHTYYYESTVDGYPFRSGLFDAKELRHNVTLTASLRF
jgi:hypothetical protein